MRQVFSDIGQSRYSRKMRCIIFISCLILYPVHASDWLNRTVRVDLIVNREASQYDWSERFSPRIVFSGIDATNGQYPWTFLTISRTTLNLGIPCSGTIISDRFFLSEATCVGRGLEHNGEVNSIEMYVGSAQWSRFNSTRPTDFVRYYWTIQESPENSPRIVLCQPLERIIFNPNIQPIRLPYAANANFTYEAWSSLILGYRLVGVDQLQFVPSKILNNNQCDFRGSIADYELCGPIREPPIGGPGFVWHFGIIGGSWMVYEYAPDLDLHPVVIGIYQVQFTNETTTFALGTRVTPFLDWIDRLTGGLFQ